MNMLPLPIIAVGRNLLLKEFFGKNHSFSDVVHAMLISSVFLEGASANSVEAVIFRVLYDRVDHPLNIIYEWIVSNKS
jgi:hypothetical protein